MLNDLLGNSLFCLVPRSRNRRLNQRQITKLDNYIALSELDGAQSRREPGKSSERQIDKGGERAGKLAGAVECQKHVGERAEGRGHGHGGGATLDWMMAFGLEGQSRLRTLVHVQTITVTMTTF